MIKDLDDTIKAALQTLAAPNSLLASADISFDQPDKAWRDLLHKLTVNCYLYDIRQNMAMRTNEPIVVRSADNMRATRVLPPARIDCAYCITAWSPAQTGAVFEEHRLLSQVLRLFLQYPMFPQAVLMGSLSTQLPPFPGIAASQEGVKNMPEFWNALDQKLKPSLNYIVTLAMLPEDIPADNAMGDVARKITVDADHLE